MPNAAPPAKASPLSLSKIRLYRGTIVGWPFSAGFHRRHVPHFVPDETRNGDILLEFRDLGLDQLSDGKGGFLDEGLLEQADLFIKLSHTSLDDALGDVGRLAFEQRAGELDLALFVESVRRHVLFGDITRVRGRDVHGHIVYQLLEVFRARHEIGLAIHFHHDAQLTARVNIGADQSLPGGARRFLARGGNTTFPQDDLRRADIATGFHQGGLAFHHPSASALAKLLYELSGDFRHNPFKPD